MSAPPHGACGPWCATCARSAGGAPGAAQGGDGGGRGPFDVVSLQAPAPCADVVPLGRGDARARITQFLQPQRECQLRRVRSRELVRGLFVECSCGKRNGLQDECKHTMCDSPNCIYRRKNPAFATAPAGSPQSSGQQVMAAVTSLPWEQHQMATLPLQQPVYTVMPVMTSGQMPVMMGTPAQFAVSSGRPAPSAPMQTTSVHSMPMRTVSQQNVPMQTASMQNIPLQTVSMQNMPMQTTSMQNMPMQTTSMHNMPTQETGHMQGMPGQIGGQTTAGGQSAGTTQASQATGPAQAMYAKTVEPVYAMYGQTTGPMQAMTMQPGGPMPMQMMAGQSTNPRVTKEQAAMGGMYASTPMPPPATAASSIAATAAAGTQPKTQPSNTCMAVVPYNPHSPAALLWPSVHPSVDYQQQLSNIYSGLNNINQCLTGFSNNATPQSLPCGAHLASHTKNLGDYTKAFGAMVNNMGLLNNTTYSPANPANEANANTAVFCDPRVLAGMWGWSFPGGPQRMWQAMPTPWQAQQPVWPSQQPPWPAQHVAWPAQQQWAPQQPWLAQQPWPVQQAAWYPQQAWAPQQAWPASPVPAAGGMAAGQSVQPGAPAPCWSDAHVAFQQANNAVNLPLAGYPNHAIVAPSPCSGAATASAAPAKSNPYATMRAAGLPTSKPSTPRGPRESPPPSASSGSRNGL